MKQGRSKTTQTAVRLPSAVLERLRQSELGVSEQIRRALERVQAQDAIAPLAEAAAKNQRTIAAEIEQRLARTFAEDALDPVTAELVLGVINLAADVQRELGARWHDYVELHSIFYLALAERLDFYKPAQKASAFMHLARDMGWNDEAASQVKLAPDVLGHMIERADRRAHTYEHLQRFERAERERAKRRGSPLSSMRKKEKDNE